MKLHARSEGFASLQLGRAKSHQMRPGATKNFDMKMKFNFKLKVNFQTYFELMMLTSCICDKWIVLQTDMSTHEVHVTALAGGCHTRDLEPKCDNAMP